MKVKNVRKQVTDKKYFFDIYIQKLLNQRNKLNLLLFLEIVINSSILN